MRACLNSCIETQVCNVTWKPTTFYSASEILCTHCCGYMLHNSWLFQLRRHGNNRFHRTTQHSFEGTKENHVFIQNLFGHARLTTVSYFKWTCFVMKHICISAEIYDPLIKGSMALWTTFLEEQENNLLHMYILSVFEANYFSGML